MSGATTADGTNRTFVEVESLVSLSDELDEHFQVFAIQRIFSFELFDTEAGCAHD